MNNTITPLAHLDLSEITDLFDAKTSPDDIAQHLTGALQPSMPAGVTINVWSINGYETDVEPTDGMTGTEVSTQISLLDMDVVPGELVGLLDELEIAAASAATGLVHVPFAGRRTKRNARSVLLALRIRLGDCVAHLGSKNSVAIYRLPGAFVGAPIFAIDMLATHAWSRFLDAQFGEIPDIRGFNKASSSLI
jgi:hypothetical protein